MAAATGQAELRGAAEGLFEACIAAIPYAPATAFLASEQAKLAAIPDGPTAARPGGTASARAWRSSRTASAHHGVTRTIEEIRQRGVPGFEIEVVGTDPEVDRRLSAVAEIDVPFYPGLRIGVPSLPARGADARGRTAEASTRSTSARPARPASPARSSRARWACRCSAATTPS